MKSYQTGVWIDSKHAYLVRFTEAGRDLKKMDSGIESQVRFAGEDKAYTRVGEVYIDPEKTKENRRDHQAREFFKRIVRELQESESIVVFGPAEMKIELGKEIREDRELSKRLRGVETADHMTENQLFAWVADYFNKG